jgi:threonine synthase
MRCKSCGGCLEVAYLPEESSKRMQSIFVTPAILNAEGVWRYKNFLPESKANITLGEGNTPLVNCANLAKDLNIAELRVKNEGLNPSGTYKDRGIAVAVSKAIDQGYSCVTLGSAGNAGAAAAAYAAHGGIRCVLLLPTGAVPERVKLAKLYGADVISIKGSIDDCIRLSEKLQQRFGWCCLSTARPYNPYCVEGYKTIGYELCEQYAFNMPDWLIVPIGGGSLVSKIWEGICEIKALGLIDKVPHMIGVQAEGCCPYVKHYQTKKPVERWGDPDTIAFAIADVWPFDAKWVDKTLEDSKGTAFAVSDDDIRRAQRNLVRKNAILAEPSSATVVAALEKGLQNGLIDKKDRVCCVVSGNGIKDLTQMSSDIPMPVPIENDFDLLIKTMQALKI